jgi:hypothetical protein
MMHGQQNIKRKITLSENEQKQYKHSNCMIIQPHNFQRNTTLLVLDIIGDADEHPSVSTTISI